RDFALDAVGPAEHGGGRGEVAVRDGASDRRAAELVRARARGRDLADDLGADAGGLEEAAEIVAAARATGAEAEVGADDDGGRTQAAEQELGDEVVGRGVGEGAGEGEDDEGVDAEGGGDAEALAEGLKAYGGALGGEDLGRVGLEGDEG